MNDNGLDLTYGELEVLRYGLRDKIEDLATSLHTDKADPEQLAEYVNLYAKLSRALELKPVVAEGQSDEVTQ